MAEMIATLRAETPGASAATTTRVTRALLACGVLAGPLFEVVVLSQALTRDGFDITRHAASLLSNGDLGWIQIANFLVTGALTTACAVGMRRVLHPGRGGTWGPVLIGAYGIGMIAAGVFVADPMDGFPVGTPAGAPEAISWHGILHMVGALVSFAGLVAGCFVLARRFAGLGQRGWAAYSRITAVLFLAGFGAVSSGSGGAASVLAFWVAVALAWAWFTAIAARLMTELPDND